MRHLAVDKRLLRAAPPRRREVIERGDLLAQRGQRLRLRLGINPIATLEKRPLNLIGISDDGRAHRCPTLLLCSLRVLRTFAAARATASALGFLALAGGGSPRCAFSGGKPSQSSATYTARSRCGRRRSQRRSGQP
jgi:hypothetical protein